MFHSTRTQWFPDRSHQHSSRLKVQKLRDQSESSSVFLRGCTHLVRSVYGMWGTEWVRSGYGAGTELGGFTGGGGLKLL